MKGIEGMKNNWNNSLVFRFFDYVFRLVLINLIIIIPSFLFFIVISLFFKEQNNLLLNILALIPIILYLYPAICAGVNVIRLYELRETNSLFKDFFKSFIKNYFKALLETIIIGIAIVLFFNSIRYFYLNLNQGIINIFGLIASIGFALMFLIIFIHLPLIMAYGEGLNIIQDFKLAFLMAFKDLLSTIIVAVITIIWAFIIIRFDTIFIILITVGMSLPMYLAVKLTFKKYYIVYLRTNQDEKERINNGGNNE